MTDPVLPGFEGEVAERDAIWRNPGNVPRMEVRRHRDNSITRVMVRSDGHTITHPEGDDQKVRAVTIHFTDAEWALLERAVLAGRGLTTINESE